MKQNERPHLSDDDLNLYRALVQAGDDMRWKLGDLLIEHRAYFERASDLFRYVATQTGEKMTTLRGCHWLALHVPVEIRDKYPLTRSQFRACLSWATQAEDFEERLDLLVEMCEWAVMWGDEHGGSPAPVQVIENHIATLKLRLELEIAERAPNPTTERTAILKAARVLLSLNGATPPGVVALARVIGLQRK